MACVYVLHLASSPEEIRYVGITKYENPATRLKAHIKVARTGRKTPLYDWIRKHEDEVSVTLLSGSLTWEEAGEREKYFIKKYRELDYKILNLTDGGCGIFNPSPEVRKKMSDAAKARPVWNKGKTASKETKEKISKANSGKKRTQEVKDAISARNTGSKRSAATKAKMSQSLKGRVFSEEHRQNISNAKKGSIPWNKKAG